MKTSLKKKILEIYSIVWIPFLIILILTFYIVLSMQLNRLAVETLKTQSYNSQIYAIRYLKTMEKGHALQGLEKAADYFAKYMSETSGVRVQIYNMDNMLADSERGEFPRTKDVRGALEMKSYVFFNYDGIRYLSFSSPIINLAEDKPEQSIGVIRYIYPMVNEKRFLLQVVCFMGLFSTMMMAITVLLTKKLAEKTTESVNILKDSVTVMQSGNLTQKVRIDSNDEMEELGEAFDTMRERLKEYIERLDSQGKQMQQFFNNVAHQLKTPLTSIIGYSQMIQVSNNPDEICEDAFIIEEAGEKLLKSIETILQDSKRKAEWAPLHIEMFELKELIQSAFRLLEPRLNRMQIKTVCDCEEGIFVQSDAEVLKEIILTLIDNAIVHSGCRNLLISAKQIEEKTYLFVKDDGCGILEKDKEYIFKAFYQVSEQSGKGSGLGLSICAALVKRLNGTLKLQDGTEKGAEFMIEIPKLYL